MSNDLIVDQGFAVLNNFQPPKPGDNTKEVIDEDLIIPRYPFASFDSALSISQRDAFLNDCSTVFTARTKEDSDSYSTGETFFLPCLMKPRCALEALAHAIFHAHVDGLQDNSSNGTDPEKLLYDPERSGAEWWTLVLDASSTNKGEATPQKEPNDEDAEEEDDEVGMHFDADYGLESQMPNFMIHPRVATITYLSEIGVPTLILDKQSPAPSDAEKQSLAGEISRAWLSHPRFGKHVAFDGRFLHGAPGEFFPGVGPEHNFTDASEPKAKKAKVEHSNNNASSGKRVTFLVNIWLNHCPIDADILDDDIVSKLTTTWEDSSQGKLKKDESYSPPFEWNIKDVTSGDKLGDDLKLTKATPESDGPAGIEEDLIICNRHVDMKFGATMDDFHAASKLAHRKISGSAVLLMTEGVLSLQVGKEATSDDEEEDD